MAKHIGTTTEFNDLLEKGTVIVDFFATWCAPCKQVAPKFEKFATANAEKASFIKIDVEELEDIADTYNVESLPTFAVFKDKKLAFRVTGNLWDNIEAELKKYI